MAQHEFRWESSVPERVQVAGNWEDWKGSFNLERLPSGKFSGKATLPFNTKVLFKYIVDGHWQINPTEPHEDDGSGNVNNVLHIGSENLSKSESPATSPSSGIPGEGILAAIGGAAVAAAVTVQSGISSASNQVSEALASQSTTGDFLVPGEAPKDPANTPSADSAATSLPTLPSSTQVSQAVHNDSVLPIVPETDSTKNITSVQPASTSNGFIPVVPVPPQNATASISTSKPSTEPQIVRAEQNNPNKQDVAPHTLTLSEKDSNVHTIPAAGGLVASHADVSGLDKGEKTIGPKGDLVPAPTGAAQKLGTTTSAANNKAAAPGAIHVGTTVPAVSSASSNRPAELSRLDSDGLAPAIGYTPVSYTSPQKAASTSTVSKQAPEKADGAIAAITPATLGTSADSGKPGVHEAKSSTLPKESSPLASLNTETNSAVRTGDLSKPTPTEVNKTTTTTGSLGAQASPTSKGNDATAPQSATLTTLPSTTGTKDVDKKAVDAKVVPSSSATAPTKGSVEQTAAEAHKATAELKDKKGTFGTLGKSSSSTPAAVAPATPVKQTVTPPSSESTPAKAYTTAPSTPSVTPGTKERNRKSSFFQKIKVALSPSKH